MAPSIDDALLVAANGADSATQQARVRAIKGNNVLYVVPERVARHTWGRPHSRAGVHARFAAVTGLGVNVYLVLSTNEENREMYDVAKELGLVAGAVFVDMGDPATAVRVDRVLEALPALGIEFHGVLTSFEESVVLKAALAERLGLPGNPTAAYEAAQNKMRCREVCSKAGLVVPRFVRVDAAANLQQAAEYVGFPLVLKPMVGMGSEGVVKCTTLDELESAYEKLRSDLDANRFELIGAKFNGERKFDVMLESFIDGTEHDVDILVWDGQLVYGNVVDNDEPRAPYFLEDSVSAPSTLPSSHQAELVAYALQCVRALGFTQGAFHVECKYTDRTMQRPDGKGQPMLIEVNARVGGGPIIPWHRELFGVDLLLNMLLASCGIPINPPRHSEPTGACALKFLLTPATGVVASGHFLDHLKGHPAVATCTPYKAKGDWVRGHDRGMPEWVGEFSVRAETAVEARELANQLERTVHVHIEPIKLECAGGKSGTSGVAVVAA